MTATTHQAARADVLQAVHAVWRALFRAASATFSGTGVGLKQVQILGEIREARSISQVDLAAATLSDPAGMMRALDALERRGWTQRTACKEDRRRKLVSLTAEGRKALGELDGAFRALSTLANGALTAAERRQFCALAAKLHAALEAGAGPGPGPEDC